LFITVSYSRLELKSLLADVTANDIGSSDDDYVVKLIRNNRFK